MANIPAAVSTAAAAAISGVQTFAAHSPAAVGQLENRKPLPTSGPPTLLQPPGWALTTLQAFLTSNGAKWTSDI